MVCSCGETKNKNCIEQVPIFSNLTKEEMLEVAHITRSKSFKKGEMIYMAGDKGERLYIVNTGKVKVTRFSNSGKEQVIRILEPGEFMGEVSLFTPSPMTDNGEALEDTRMCMIGGEDIKSLIRKYPDIAFKIMEELGKRLEIAENLIENINLYSVERRLAETLLSMVDDNNEINLNMSKRELASHIGMSQETLSRQLSAFQQLGIIKLKGHRKIKILDKVSLKEIE